MQRSVAKIVIVLLVVVLLPVMFYISDRLTSLNKNEAVVEQVFSKQLESILFSINQHSENVIKQWVNKINIPVSSESDVMQKITTQLLENNIAIHQINFINADNFEILAEYCLQDGSIKSFPFPEKRKIDELKEFLANNYQKIEPLPLNGKLALYFLTQQSEQYILVLLVIDPLTFVQQNMRTEIQQIARDLFYIQILGKKGGSVMFSTEEVNTVSAAMQSSDLWYLPDYEVRIRLKTKTIKEMVAERTQKENYVLWGIALVVLSGMFFIIRSIRKEMKLAEMKSEFVSNVSHEIRTPLASISMYTETLMLKRIQKEERKDEYLKTIHTETQRLSEMVNRILNFSRMEKNKRKYFFEEVNIDQIIPEVLKTFEAQFQKGKIDVLLNAEENLPVIRADRDALTEMFINLVDNAIKYSSKENPKIEIRGFQQKKHLFVEVEDNGIGISAKDKKYIFNKFYRVTKGNLALHAQGSGLGLNIVQQIIKAHKAEISVRSKLGEGSCFSIKFSLSKNKGNG